MRRRECSPTIDLERTIDGSETSVEMRRAGCSDGITIELWYESRRGNQTSRTSMRTGPTICSTGCSNDSRRTSRSMLRKLGILGLGVPLIAIIVALGYLFFFGETEPTFEDATQQLASDHTVYGLDLEGRRAALVAPFGSDPSQELPLIIALHGYGSNVWEHSQYMGLIPRVNLDRFLLLMPNGTARQRLQSHLEPKHNFATSRFGGRRRGILELLDRRASELVRVGSIYAVRAFNGGFMSYRLACGSLRGWQVFARSPEPRSPMIALRRWAVPSQCAKSTATRMTSSSTTATNNPGRAPKTACVGRCAWD